MRKRRSILVGTAALLTRGVVKLVDAGTRAVTSSTRGLQDLYREAKSEYDSERASVRTVGSPIVMPGASPASGSPLIYTSSDPPMSQSGIVSTPLAAQGPLNGSSSEPETGPRKRGRPRKESLLETAPSQGSESTVILGSDGKPARKKRSASVQEKDASTPKPRGRPRRPAEPSVSENGSSSRSSSTTDVDMLQTVTTPHTLSELDGTTEAPVIPDDLTPAGGVSETPVYDENTVEGHQAFGSAGEAPVE